MMRSKLALPLLPFQDVELPSIPGKREFIHSHHSFPATINHFIARASLEKRQDLFASNQPAHTGVYAYGYNRYESLHYGSHSAAACIGSSRDG